MTDDELYLNAIMKQRIMRQTHDSKTLHRIYADKYANWLVPFFKEHDILDIPVLCICNTLYRLPDYFRIEEKSAFIFDYYLYSYIYDLNYVLFKPENNQFMVNLYTKIYIECLYLHKQFDECYWFCENSINIESFKERQDYQNQSTMYQLLEFSDIQEAVILLHEASHFIFECYSEKVKESKRYREILDLYYINLKAYGNNGPIFEMINDSNFNIYKFLEECYCDSESICFVMNRTLFKNSINNRDLFTQLFRTIISMYFLHFTMAHGGKYAEIYNDCYMQQLVYRLSNAYSTMLSFLLENEMKDEIKTLKTIYQEQIKEFTECGEQIRQMFKIIEKELFKDISYNEVDKQSFIKEFLKLI